MSQVFCTELQQFTHAAECSCGRVLKSNVTTESTADLQARLLILMVYICDTNLNYCSRFFSFNWASVC